MDVAWPRVLGFVRDERDTVRRLRSAFSSGWTEIAGREFGLFAKRSPPVRTLRVVDVPTDRAVVVGRNFRLKGLQMWGCSATWLAECVDDEDGELGILRVGLRIASEISCKARGVRILDIHNVVLGPKTLSCLAFMSELEFVRIRAQSCQQQQSSSSSFRFSSEKIWALHFSCADDGVLASRTLLHGIVRPEKLEELHLPVLTHCDMQLLSKKLPRLQTLVVTDWRPADDAETVAVFFQQMTQTLTSLLLTIRRETQLDIDYVLWGLAKFGKHHPEKLRNFQLVVGMADNGDLLLPEVGMDWAVYFRCKWKSNLFFRRHSLGVEMHHTLGGSSSQYAALQTPMDLFALEMCDGDVDPHEAWMGIHEMRRLDYTDIFDAIFLSTAATQTARPLEITRRQIVPRN